MNDISEEPQEKATFPQERDPYQHYYKLSERDISRRLAKKRIPEATRSRLFEVILDGKEKAKAREASEKRKAYLWRVLLDPAKYEMKMVLLILTRTKQQVESGYYANPEEGEARVLALELYHRCIGRWVIREAQDAVKQGKTPQSVAREKTKRFPSGLPNGGIHWVDWVPFTVREQVTEYFDAIPHRAKAKRKIPFERKMPKLSRIDNGEVLSVFEEKRILLRERTERALEKTEKMAHINPDKYGDDVYNIKQALRYINAAQEGELLPSSWRGFTFFNKEI